MDSEYIEEMDRFLREHVFNDITNQSNQVCFFV